MVLFILVNIPGNFSVKAQIPGTIPDEPVLESVSIDPVTGYVTITWYPMDPPVSPVPTDGYIIYWLRTSPSSSNHAIAVIKDPAARSYTFNIDTMVSQTPQMPDPRKTTVPFTIATYSNSPPSTSLRSDEDYNMQLTCKYDSCRAEMRLNWYPYRGWYHNREPYHPLICYRVMQIPDGGGAPVEVKILSDQDTSCILSNIQENARYTFYIEAERNDGLKVTSYRVEKFTQMPIPPSFVEAEGTRYDDQGLAEVTFKLDPNSQTYNYEFLGSSRPDYSFVSLGNPDNITGNEVTLTDIQTREKTYYYRLAAWHVCKNRYTAESNTATALWLYLKQDDQINTLQWDAYSDWGIPVEYQVHRKIGEHDDEVIVTLGNDETTVYRDDVSGMQIDGDICYRIVATPESPVSPGQQAVSNVICIQPESEIFIPKAFTPNSDGANDEFRPYFSYDPQEYVMTLYDRNGAQLFQTKNIGDSWDGRLKNGKPASEGVYAYFIKFRTAKGRLVEKRGTFLLVIP